MTIETRTICTCDLCEVPIDVPQGAHPRDVKRTIPGVPAWEASPVHLAMIEGGNMSWPFDLCASCWKKAWDGLDPKGTLRRRISDQVERSRSGRSRV